MASAAGKRKQGQVDQWCSKKPKYSFETEDDSSVGSQGTLSLTLNPIDVHTVLTDEEYDAIFGDDHDEDDDYTSDTPTSLSTYTRSRSSSRKRSVNESPALCCSFEGCYKVFTRPVSLRNHEKSHKHGRQQLECPFEGCNRVFNRQAYLDDHAASHTGERKFKCDQCEKDFLRPDHLRRHVRSTHESHWFKCQRPYCTRLFPTMDHLNRHYEDHNENSKKKAHFCPKYPECPMLFRKAAALQRHIKSRHDNPAHQCNKPHPVTGELCSKTYSSNHHLNRHIADFHVQARYTCIICIAKAKNENARTAATFAGKAELFAHEREAHPPQCGVCHKTFRHNYNLKMHEAIHQSDLAKRKAVTCTASGCQQSFTSKSSLQKHLRAHHERRRDFICGQTDLTSVEHVQGWDGKDACGRGFTYKNVLINHIRTHHLGLDQRGHKRNQRKERRRVQKQSARSVLTAGFFEEKDGSSLECVFPECPLSFDDQNGFVGHLRMMHRLEDEDIEEIIADREALHGGPFWIGGLEDEEGEDFISPYPESIQKHRSTHESSGDDDVAANDYSEDELFNNYEDSEDWLLDNGGPFMEQVIDPSLLD